MKLIKWFFWIAIVDFVIMAGVVTTKTVNNEKLIINNVKPSPKVTVTTPLGIPTKTLSTFAPTTDNRCLITINGKRYDVTEYRNQHSGGDIFNCGTDMSDIFHGQHSNSMLKRMRQYLI